MPTITTQTPYFTSIPLAVTHNILYTSHENSPQADVAQLVEQLIRNQ